jgi:hypothetical protein
MPTRPPQLAAIDPAATGDGQVAIDERNSALRGSRNRPGLLAQNPGRMVGSMRSWFMLPLVLSGIAASGEAALERPLRLTGTTLSPRERLDLPFYRTAVGPEQPHRVAGRSEPITFAVQQQALFIDADGEPGCELEVVPGAAVEVALDAGRLALLILAGDVAAGEPQWSVVNLGCLSATIGRDQVRFVDLDADGSCLTPFVDFLIGKRGEVLHPVAPTLVLSRDVVRFRGESAGLQAWITPDPEFADRECFPDFAGALAGLLHLNALRGRMNLPPVALSRSASRAVLLHIGYLERNGGNGHVERNDFPGYTREGAVAGLNSIGWMGGGGVPGAIDGHLSSLLHRMDLIDPRSTEIGIASRGQRIWIYTQWGLKRAWNGQGPVIFPGPRNVWPTGSYSGDNPDPRPEEYRGGCGLPITCAWFGEEVILRVKAEVEVAGRPIRAFRNDSEHRDLKMNHPAARAVFLPKDTLKSGLLKLTWEQDGKACRLEYRFKIG